MAGSRITMLAGVTTMRVYLLALLTVWSLTGCAGAVIRGVRATHPADAELMVNVESHELFSYQQPNTVLALYDNYVAKAPVPLKGGPQPERFEIVLNEWSYVPGRRRDPRSIEIQYMMGTRILKRRRFPSPFVNPSVIADAIKKQREAATAPPPPPARPPTPPPGRTVRDADAREVSRSLDAPTPHQYPSDLVCRLDAHSGPRYLRLTNPPNKLVQLTIDVKSAGDPRATSEVTWWSVELLDEKGRPLPHMEKDMVDLGGEYRHIAEWRFDGSVVIFKITSGSDAGDTIRIRFQELE